MIIIRKIILVLIAMCLVQFAIAQNLKLRNASNLKVNPSISKTELKQIIKGVEAKLNEYSSAAKLLDLKNKRVTEASIDRFNNLFNPKARVVKDFAEHIPIELIHYKDYSREVYNNLLLKGVEVIIQSAELVEVKSSSLGFYEPVVLVKKKIYSHVNTKGDVKTSPAGKTIEQRFRFNIFKDDIERVDISRIEHAKTILPPDQYTRIIGISAGIGSSSYSPSASAYWDQAHSASSLNVNGGINFSFGAELITDRFITSKGATNRKLALSVGLRYASYQTKAELRSFGIEPFEQVAEQVIDPTTINTNRYMRLVGPVYADEDIRFGVIEIPLGVAYKLLNKQTSLIYLHARFIPSFVLSGSGALKGDGIYDGILFNEDPTSPNENALSEMRILRIGAAKNVEDDFRDYRVGEKQINMSATPDLAGASFALQLSPTAYFNFSDDDPSWGVMVGIDLTYHLGSFIKHNPVSTTLDNALKYEDDFEGSLMSYYTEKVSGISYGLRIGLFQRLGIDP